MARELGWYASFSVAFRFDSIATGIFTTYGVVLNTSGPRGIWAWPVTVVGQLAIALIFGALAARIPISGYAYQWVSRIANPVAGWVMGWISFSFLGVVVVAVVPWSPSTVYTPKWSSDRATDFRGRWNAAAHALATPTTP